MRRGKDEYKTRAGRIVVVSLDEEPPPGSTLWNGYNYTTQQWIHHGEKDTRTIQELRAEIDLTNRETNPCI